MGALDKKLRSQMQLELVEIIERVGVTCVMVTHDQEEAMTMAERIAIMHLGCIEQIGSPMDIYETPASRLVCEFIGNVNLFDGLMEDEQDHATIACADLEQPIYVGHGISSRCREQEGGLCPASGKTADEPAQAGRDRASGLQLDQGRGR
jgi:putrescine transport system ATP-binding protein